MKKLDKMGLLELSNFFKLDNFHKLEVISFLYKREKHRVINENTHEARMKKLDKMGFKFQKKSTDF